MCRVLGSSVLQPGKNKNHAVRIWPFPEQAPVALPLWGSPLPSALLLFSPSLFCLTCCSCSCSLPPLSLPPSLLLYSSRIFCVRQILNPPFPGLQTLKCCSDLRLTRALCKRCSRADPHCPRDCLLLQISTSWGNGIQTSLGGRSIEEKGSDD